MLFARSVLWLSALSFLAFGIVYLVSPTLWTEPTGMVLDEPAARTDVRAVYGGFQLGVGLFLLWSTRDRERWRSALLLTTLAIGACRLIGIVADNAGTLFHFVGFGIEAGYTVLALAAWRQTRIVASVEVLPSSTVATPLSEKPRSDPR